MLKSIATRFKQSVLLATTVLLFPLFSCAQHYVQTNLPSEGFISTPPIDHPLGKSLGDHA